LEIGGRAKACADLTRVGRSWRTVRPDCLAIDSASDASITKMGPSILFGFILSCFVFSVTAVVVFGIRDLRNYGCERQAGQSRRLMGTFYKLLYYCFRKPIVPITKLIIIIIK
jgi:hypothetical protein